MKNILFFALILFFLQSANASFDPDARGGKSASMGFCSVALNDFWGVFNNQASMAWDAKLNTGIFFENRYLLKEMSTRGFGLIIPATKNDAFGLTFSQYGHSAYNESKIGLSFAKSFANRVSAGLQFDYLYTSQEIESGKKGIFTFEFGLQAKVNNKMMIGFHAFNPIHSKLSNYNDFTEYIPVVLKFGLSYNFSKKFTVIAETEKNLNNNAIIRGGMEYKINDLLYVRGGLSTGVVLYSFGVGVNWKKFNFDFGTSTHQVLGVTPSISLNYNFSNLKQKNK